MEAGTHRDETAQSSKQKTSKQQQQKKQQPDASSLFCWCYLDLPNLCLQSPSRRWRSPLCSLAPPHPPSLFIVCGDYTSNLFSICSLFLVFLLCTYRSLCVKRMKGYMRSKPCSSVTGGFPSYWHCSPRQLIHRYLGGVSAHLLNACLVMVLASASETAEKVDAVCLFHKHISINSLHELISLVKCQLAHTVQPFGSQVEKLKQTAWHTAFARCLTLLNDWDLASIDIRMMNLMWL